MSLAHDIPMSAELETGDIPGPSLESCPETPGLTWVHRNPEEPLWGVGYDLQFSICKIFFAWTKISPGPGADSLVGGFILMAIHLSSGEREPKGILWRG